MKLRIILSGGGLKGLYQLGVIEELLLSKKYEIDKIYGCSIGAILSPLIINGKIKEAIKCFRKIKTINDIVEKRKFLGISIPDNIITNSYNTIFNMGVYKSIKLVDEVFSILNKEEIKNAGDKCHVVAFDIINNKEVWFSGNDLEFGIRCSSALWMVVPPIERNGNLYIDGGVTELFPLQYIIDQENKDNFNGKYLFIDCDSRIDSKNERPKNAIELMNILHWSASTSLSKLELEKFTDKINNISVIRPSENILLSGLDFDIGRMEETYKMGRNDCLKYI